MKQIPLTLAIIGLNTVIFFVLVYLEEGSIMTANAHAILKWGGNFNPYTLDGEYFRLISSLFLHFNIFHLLVNMHSLFTLGKAIEKQVGGILFLLIYFSCGIAGGIASLNFNIF